MTSAADLLRKNKTKSDFVPKVRRAWDFAASEPASVSDAVKDNQLAKKLPSSSSLGEGYVEPASSQQVKSGEKEKDTYRSQSGHKQDTNKTQKELKKGTRKLNSEHKQGTNSTRKLTQNVKRNSGYESFSSISGLQKKLIHAIFINCQIEGGRVTQPLSTDHLASLSGVSKNSVKTTLKRLKDKGAITVFESKGGRGGWSRFQISNEYYSEILCHNQTNRSITSFNKKQDIDHNQVTERYTQRYTDDTSSSSNYLNKSTTTYGSDLPKDWQDIDITALAEIFSNNRQWGKQFFGINQIKTIYKNAGDLLTSHQVQESISHFAFGLKHLLSREPYKSIKKPGAILVDSLKSGDAWNEPNYLNSNEQTMYNVFKKLLDDLNSNAKNLFESWFEEIKDEKYEYYREKGSSSEYYDMRVFKERAIEDFKKTIWPKMRKEKLKEYIADEKLIERLFAFHNIIQPQ